MIEVSVAAAPVRTGIDLRLYDELQGRLGALARGLGAWERRYPALIRADVLARAEYDRAFPHLLLRASPVAERGTVCASEVAAEGRAATGWCLSPAVCHHVYAQFRGALVPEPVMVTASGKCFRNEEGIEPGVRQLEFDMREVVLLGDATWVQANARVVARAIAALVRELGVTGRWRPAADPFFLPAARGRALVQRLAGVKHEYQTTEGVALVSVNRHRDFFGERFQMLDASGRPIHSACVAVGLDRLFHAAVTRTRALELERQAP